jgi:hypothetical protein
MNVTISKIRRLHSAIEKSLFTIEPPFDYARCVDAINLLARMIHSYDESTDELWSIGESGYASLPDLITGSYWFFSDYHGGQNSPEYSALSMLGKVFKPNMAILDKDSSEGMVWSAWIDLCPKIELNPTDCE